MAGGTDFDLDFFHCRTCLETVPART
jgi:hypothetical protein